MAGKIIKKKFTGSYVIQKRPASSYKIKTLCVTFFLHVL
jgi:hypothetical protein